LKSTSPSDTVPFGQAYREASLPGRAALVLSSWFGVGRLPKAPGTFGSLAAVPVVGLMWAFGPVIGALFLVVFVGLAIRAAGITEQILGQRDPGVIVADEVAGMLVALYLLPATWGFLAGGFFLFRLFDIAKPFPVRRLERIPGGAGVVLDDVMAGLYANLALRLAACIWGLL
jgi:phosphatidylglycerophosphatase A